MERYYKFEMGRCTSAKLMRCASCVSIAFLLLISILSSEVCAARVGNDVAEPNKTRQPNIILVLIDDMGWGDLSCFGGTAVETENIDRLAKEGIRFEQFYVNSPICSPSRVAISTGQYPTRWRITSYLNNRESNRKRGVAQWLDPKAPMLARFLNQNGYATGHFGKWHMGGQRDVGDAPLITEYGFDKSLTNFEGLGPRVFGMKHSYDGKDPVPHTLGSDKLGRGEIRYVDRALITKEYVGAAIDFIKEAKKEGKPFYVNVWPDDVHSPFHPLEENWGDGSKLDRFHGVLDTMDEQLGELFTMVREDEELKDNTLIILCSDNGPERGAGSAAGFRGFKAHLFEGGVRSPLIVWGPGLVSSERIGDVNEESVLAAMDFAPSLMKIAGVEIPASVEFDGEDLSQTLLGHADNSHASPIFFRRPPDRDRFYGVDDCPDLAVRDGKWKLLCEYDGTGATLYDLEADPQESQNLAGQYPEVTDRLRQAVVAWHESMPQDNGETFKQN